jgi:hypothetical protein
MKIRTVIGLTGAAAASLAGTAALAASPAGAGGNGAQPVPLDQLNAMVGELLPPGALNGDGGPNITITGDCPSFLFSAALGFDFLSANAHVNRIDPVTGPNNANAAGTAVLLADGAPTAYTGQAHAWFGTNVNPNGRQWFGSTISFSGTAADGSTVSFSTNPGGSINPTTGKGNGWGQVTVTCTPATNG